MRSTSAVATLALIAAASPALSAPVSYPPVSARDTTSEIEARAGLPIGTILKELGKGAGTGALFAGLTGLLGGGSSDQPAQRDVQVLKRELESLEARAGLPIGTILKELGKGAGTGALFAGLTGLLGGGSDQPAQRELDARAGFPVGTILKELGKGAGTGALFAGLTGLLGGGSDQPAQREVEVLRRELESLDARAGLPIGTILKELGKGAGTGALFAGLTGLLGGGSDQPAQREVEVLRRELESLDARAGLPVGTILKELGKGAGTGALFAGLTGLLGGGSDQPAQREVEVLKRELESLDARAGLPVGTILKELGKGAGTGALFAGLTGLLGGGSDQPAARELDELDARAGLGGLGGTIGKGLLGGIGSALAGTAIGELFSREELAELDARAGLGGLGGTIGKGLLGGIGSALAGTAIGELFSREELAELDARAGLGGLGGTIGKGLLGGIGSALAGTAIGELFSREEIDDILARGVLSDDLAAREPLSLGPIGKGILGTAVGLGASTAASEGIDALKGLFNREIDDLAAREPLSLGPIGKGILGTAVGLGASTAASEGIDALKGLFNREIDDLAAREPLSLGPIGKGILGTAVGLGASTAASEGIDALKGLFNREIDDLAAREPLSLGPIGKGILGTAAGLGASTLTSEGIDALKGLFSREIELD